MQRYALWLVVLARLLVPVQLYMSPVTVYALLPEESVSLQTAGGMSSRCLPPPAEPSMRRVTL